jgi:hypothetical protein
MTSAPTISRGRGSSPSASRTKSLAAAVSARPLAVALLIVAAIIAVRAQGTVDADVAWELWIGHQLNRGAHLYRDIVETNPPLWFWLARPVDWLSQLSHLRSDHVLIALMGLAAALSLFATDRMIGPVGPTRRTSFLAYAALILVAMPWVQIGQREHIALIATLPYAALIAARRAGRPAPLILAFSIGGGAALGFALKHYFLIVPLLLEVWLLAAQRKSWRPVRPETAAMAAVGLAYAAAMLIFAHDYFTLVVPMLLLAYGATGAKHFVDLFQPAVVTALVCILLVLAGRPWRRSEAPELVSGLIIAAVGFTIIYFIQAKGWSYHAVPMLGCAAMALAGAVALDPDPRRLTILAAPALLCLPFTIAAQQARRDAESAHDVADAVTGMRAGDTVGFLSADPSFGWHVVLQRGYRFPLRYNGFWMMQAIVSNELRGGGDPRLTQLGRRIVGETVADFECTPPRRIIVARPNPGQARSGEFDLLAFFLRDPRFARLMAHYRPVERGKLEAFELESPLERARICPRWSPTWEKPRP